MDCYLENHDFFFHYRYDGPLAESHTPWVNGAFLVVTPNKNLYQQFLLKAKEHREDETLWTHFFPPQENSLFEEDFENIFYYHDRNRVKYWMNKTENEIFDFYNNYQNKREMFVTLLGTDDYLYGVLGLNYSLKINNSNFPLKVLVTDNCSFETYQQLERAKINYKIIPNRTFAVGGEYGCTLSKFEVFNDEQLSRFCFLDADVIATQNPDEVFSKQELFYLYKPTENHEGYNVLGNLFVSSPNSFIYTQALDYWDKTACDETILTDLFADKGILEDKKNYYGLLHAGFKPKYWLQFNNDFDTIKKFIDQQQGRKTFDETMLDPNINL